jgi:transcription antitermination factor NusG
MEICVSIFSPADSLMPKNLFEVDRTVFQSVRWWVLHTKPRAEKVIAGILASKRISYFLPLYKQQRRIQRRQVTSFLPLFPGYMFIHGGDEERVVAFETNRIANCIHVEDQTGLDRDLSRINASLNSGLPMLPEERIQPGTPAEIVNGPLAGHQGIIVRAGNKMKFVIEVNFLQRGAAIEVDSSMIRRI